MVSFFKSILAVWIGVFLILPSCFCQLLVGLGIDVHEGMPRTQGVTVSASAAVIACHCDDDCPKVADILPPVSLDAAPCLICLGTVDVVSPGFYREATRVGSLRGPPDGLIVSASVFRARSCSWLV